MSPWTQVYTPLGSLWLSALVATIPVGSNPFGVAFDGSNIWVTNWGSGTVSKL